MEGKENKREIEITSPEKDDMRGIQQVIYETWLSTYPNEEYGITKEDIEDKFKDRFTDEYFAKTWSDIEKNSDRKMFLAKENGKVVGMIVITFYPKVNELQVFYVLPKYQHMGIGKKLWMEAQKYLDPRKNVVVHVVTYNENAVHFYQALGFKDTGKRWNFKELKLKSGATFPMMELELNISETEEKNDAGQMQKM